MKKGKILVTGASGFVGATLVRKLIESGEHVRGFVRAGSDLRPFADLPASHFELAYGDITVDHTVFRALYGCNRLFHVATSYQWGARHPKEVMTSAVLGTQAVLEAARRQKLDKTVVTSSYGALGISTSREPMDEGHEFNLNDPEVYVEAKRRALEVALEAAHRGQPVTVVLPGSIVGPGDRKPTPTGRCILAYLRTSPGVQVSVPDGGLNIVDVEDVANGHILAMAKGKPGETYLLGGQDLTFAELVSTLSDVTGLASGKPGMSASTARFLGGLLALYSRLKGEEPLVTPKLLKGYTSGYAWIDSQKAERELGYQHRSARLALGRAVAWFLDQGYVPDRFATRIRLELRSA